MSAEEHKLAVQNLIEKGLNQKDLTAFNPYYAPDVIDHALPPTLPPGLEGRKMFASAFLGAFPDIHVHIEDLIAEGNRVVTRWSAHGTHRGELMGIPATGKTVNFTGIAMDRFENGRSVEHWEEIDQLGLMQQLGVIPAE